MYTFLQYPESSSAYCRAEFASPTTATSLPL